MTTKHEHDNPILVTGAAGAVGGIGRNLTEFLLAKGHKVRALVRREDERAEALRRLGAEVVAGDLTDLASMHRAGATVQESVRRVGKGAFAPCPPFFKSNVFTASGGHAAERVRARPLCPPNALLPYVIAAEKRSTSVRVPASYRRSVHPLIRSRIWSKVGLLP